ncbi:uncharacterized protein DMENIID0001_148750 [Sergentomyia squamirostris]
MVDDACEFVARAEFHLDTEDLELVDYEGYAFSDTVLSVEYLMSDFQKKAEVIKKEPLVSERPISLESTSPAISLESTFPAISLESTSPALSLESSSPATGPVTGQEVEISENLLLIKSIENHFKTQQVIVYKEGSQLLLEKGRRKAHISETEKRAIVGIIVDHLKTTRKEVTPADKIAYAIAAIHLFPVLANNTGIGRTHDTFYNPTTYCGYIPSRLRSLRREVLKRERSFGKVTPRPKKSAKKRSATADRSSLNEFDEDELVSIKADLKLLNPVRNLQDIIDKTIQTRPLRDLLLPDDEPIWEQYPRFLDTFGLIHYDFENRFPNAAPKLKDFLLEKTDKIFEVTEADGKKLTEPMKEWHEDIKVLACLLFLLPTSTSARNGVSRISTEKALKEIIDFLPPNKQPEIAAKIPKILAQGTSKKDIRKYYVNVGTYLIPTQDTFIDALDLYFKSFHVFKVQFLPPLRKPVL